MKVIKKKTIKYKLVVPETKEEKEELDKVIKDVKEEDKQPFDSSKWKVVDNRKKYKDRLD